MKNKVTTVEKWEDRFRKKYWTQLIDDYGDEHLYDSVIDFISTILAQSVQEAKAERDEYWKLKLMRSKISNKMLDLLTSLRKERGEE